MEVDGVWVIELENRQCCALVVHRVDSNRRELLPERQIWRILNELCGVRRGWSCRGGHDGRNATQGQGEASTQCRSRHVGKFAAHM